MDIALWIVIVVVSYLIGAVPTAYLICKQQGINIFEIGSGNMGATNVARALGSRYALLTWVIDVLKGLVPVLAARLIYTPDPLVGGVGAAYAAMLGHSWSVWVLLLTGKLRGGKAASTTAGTWMGLAPFYVTAGGLALMAVLLWRTKLMSLSVLITITFGVTWLLILTAQGLQRPLMAVYAVITLGLIVFKHRENIQRLRQGKERQVGEKRETS